MVDRGPPMRSRSKVRRLAFVGCQAVADPDAAPESWLASIGGAVVGRTIGRVGVDRRWGGVAVFAVLAPPRAVVSTRRVAMACVVPNGIEVAVYHFK